MLIVFIIGGVLLGVIGLVFDSFGEHRARESFEIAGVVFCVFGFIGAIICFVVALIALSYYNDTRSTVAEKVRVCELCKKELLAELDSTIADYCGYESDFYEQYKNNPEKAIFNLYPMLKGDAFYSAKFECIQSYNKRIMDLMMERVELKSYKLWLGDLDWLYGKDE